MNKLTDIDSSILFKEPPQDVDHGKKVVLLGKKLTWMTEEEITRNRGKEIITSTEVIAQLIGKIDVSELKVDQLDVLKRNILLIDHEARGDIQGKIKTIVGSLIGKHKQSPHEVLSQKIQEVEAQREKQIKRHVHLFFNKVVVNKLKQYAGNRANLSEDSMIMRDAIRSFLDYDPPSEILPLFVKLFPYLTSDGEDKNQVLQKFLPLLPFESLDAMPLSEEETLLFLFSLDNRDLPSMGKMTEQQMELLERSFIRGDIMTLSAVQKHPFFLSMFHERARQRVSAASTSKTRDSETERARQSHNQEIVTRLRGFVDSREKLTDPFARAILTKSLLDYDPPSEIVPFIVKLLPSLPIESEDRKQVCQKYLPLLSFEALDAMQLTEEEKLSFLFSLDDTDLNSMGKITEPQMQVLERRFREGQKETVLGVQNHRFFRHALMESLKRSSDYADPNSYSNAAVEVLENVDRFGKFVPSDSLIKVLLYVRQNKEAMAKSGIGTKSKSRVGYYKIKASQQTVPMDLIYHPEKGEIIVKLGLLGGGTFKIVKSQLFVQKMELEAIGKQEKTKMSEKEWEVMDKVKGKDLPHVAQWHTVYSYYSTKKGKWIIASVMHQYNAGELEKYLEKKYPTMFKHFSNVSKTINVS